MLKKITKLAAHAQTHLTVLTSTAVLCCSLVNTAQAIPFSGISQLYFFGDSLTDSGFNNFFPLGGIPGYPYPSGKAPTFTTNRGYTYSQYMARDIKKYTLIPPGDYVVPGNIPPYVDTITNNTTPLAISPAECAAIGGCPVDPVLTGINYAAGGSTTNSTGNDFVWAPSLHQQVDHFLKTHPGRLDSKALYIIWSGANDILEVLADPTATELTFLKAANRAAKNIGHDVALLSAKGAKRVVVLSLPNIGYTPLIDALAATIPTLPASMKNVTFSFNSMLNTELGKVIKKYGTNILYYDVYDLLDNVILATKAGKPYYVDGVPFYFTNYNQPVCGYYIPPGSTTPMFVSAITCQNESDGYIFADDVHPTDMAHRLLSLEIEQAIHAWK